MLKEHWSTVLLSAVYFAYDRSVLLPLPRRRSWVLQICFKQQTYSDSSTSRRGNKGQRSGFRRRRRRHQAETSLPPTPSFHKADGTKELQQTRRPLDESTPSEERCRILRMWQRDIDKDALQDYCKAAGVVAAPIIGTIQWMYEREVHYLEKIVFTVISLDHCLIRSSSRIAALQFFDL